MIWIVTQDREVGRRLEADVAAAGFESTWRPDPPADVGEGLIVVDLRLIGAVTEAGLIGRVPVVLLVNGTHAPPVRQLEACDDFIFYPCDRQELALRLKRLFTQSAPANSQVTAGGLTINLQSYEVAVEGRIVELTFKEYELLRYLATHPGRVFTREALLNQIWDYDYLGGTRTVDVHIRRLRAKLGTRYAELIQTVRQVGYRFSKEPPD